VDEELRLWMANVLAKLFLSQGPFKTWRTMTLRRVAGILWTDEQTMITDGDGNLCLLSHTIT
jgi:hypothetical protein